MTIKTWQERMLDMLHAAEATKRAMQAEIDELRAAQPCKYNQAAKTCTLAPMDCPCAIDAALAQPQVEATLPFDVVVGGCKFRKGVKLETFVNAAHPKASEPAPCDAGSVCLNCQPRNADGSCPDAAPKSPEYKRGFSDGLKEAPECQCKINGLGDDSVNPRVYPSEPAPASGERERERLNTLSAMAREQLNGWTIVYDTESGLMKSVPKPASNPWKDAVLDQLASHAIDAPGDMSPAEILNRIIDMATTMATDPAISEPAQGWTLVPVVATGRMTWVGQSMRYDGVISIGSIYAAMLAAAPQPPQAVPMTDEQAMEMADYQGIGESQAECLIRAVEAHHGITK